MSNLLYLEFSVFNRFKGQISLQFDESREQIEEK